MARTTSKLSINDVSKGLYSDFSELATPQGVSIDESNVSILQTGARRRRRGVAIEPTGTVYGTLTEEQVKTYWIEDYKWASVAGIGNLDFIVLQVGNLLYFYDSGTITLSEERKSFTVDLQTYKTSTASSTAYSGISVSVVKGALFVASTDINPFYITYDQDTDAITVHVLDIKTRDFSQQDISTAVNVESTSASASLKYDLLNQGWYVTSVTHYDNKNASALRPPLGTVLLDAFVQYDGKYPSRNGAWYLGRLTIDAATTPQGKFSYLQRNAVLRGNSIAPLGHYIVNPFYIDRSSVSGIPGIAVEYTTERPVAIASLAGRVFYGLKNTIYYSQLILEDLRVADKCYQEADPTNEGDNSLVDTDGGTVTIPEMGRLISFFTIGLSLVVYADNGIWILSGTSGGGFRATDYGVSKISSVGIFTSRSIVDADGTPIWWGTNGIYILKPNPVDANQYDIQNVIDKRLMSYYNGIPVLNKQYLKGSYDPPSKTISWAFKSTTDDESSSYWRFKYDRILNFNISFDCFFPYTFDLTEIDTYLSGILNVGLLYTTSEFTDVVDDSGVLVVNSTAVQVVANSYTLSDASTTVKLWIFSKAEDDTYNWSFGYFGNSSFIDWEDYTVSGVDYTSYLSTFYHLVDDTMAEIQAPYVFIYTRNTETDAETNVPSSLLFQTRWGWSSTSTSNKFSTPAQAYKHRQLLLTSIDDPTEIDTGYPIVVSKNKVRGRGRAMQLHYYSETGKDFELLGWAVVFNKNSNV